MAKILIVDDEIGICEEFRDVLQEDNHDVDFATSGEEALRKIQETSYDLVFLDVLMPRMEGREVLEEIKKVRQVPVAIISGYLPPHKEKNIMALGAVACFKKPLELKKIKELVEFIQSQKAS
ncbi:MAG TPA: response regulator [bacterium]|nr:response regulator [bacterium]